MSARAVPDEDPRRTPPDPRSRRRRLAVPVTVVVALVVLAGVVAWERWQVGGGETAWSASVDGARRVADYDDERVLVETETGFAVLSRDDGTIMSTSPDLGPAWEPALLELGTGSLALVDGGVFVGAYPRSGSAAMGVVGEDGEWVWSELADERQVVMGMDGQVAVVHAPGSGRLFGVDVATAEESWSRRVGDAYVLNSPLYEFISSAAAFRDTSLLAVERPARGERPGTVTVLAAEDGDVVTDLAMESDDAWTTIGPDSVVMSVDDPCALRLVHGGTEVPVDWGAVTPPATCDVVPPSGSYVYLTGEVDGSDRVFFLDPGTGTVSDPVIERGGGELRADGALRWLPVETTDGFTVYDGTTGEEMWSHAWAATDPEGTDVVEILDVGADGLLTRDEPTGWQRTAGGADGLVVELWAPDGDRVGAFFLESQGTEDAEILDGTEGVVVLSDGEVVMLR